MQPLNILQKDDIVISESVIKGIPVLLLCNTQSFKHPMIFIFHRFLMNKTTEFPLAFRLAKVGYFCVLVDMHGHGSRDNSFDQTMSYDFNKMFRDIYLTAVDTNEILDYLEEHYKESLDFNYIGSAGTSIGASVAMVSGYVNKRIKYIVSMIGAPCKWGSLINESSFHAFKVFAVSKDVFDYKSISEDISKYDPINHFSGLGEALPSVIFLNGKVDMIIPVKGAVEAYESLNITYQERNQQNKLLFKLYPKVGHNITEEMISDCISWLDDNIQRNRNGK